ncbi:MULTISPECIES: FkbM family methyltransferase [Rhizobium/Agrobacterium group]|uniref:FkbM family methyltransferase n=1 Tax=Rhizobium/Agrobacterium group TaxID=227290 RepID=UPI0007148C5D|nr:MULTISPECIES: FkbM family methyltransferase [Rhizobium/Agrobacterium group]KQQ45995.1 FkbM family methyltransferase [Rhizobium sp. Leaf311]
MKKLIRSLKARARKLVNAKTVKIDGIRLISDERRVPAYLRRLMFKDVYEDTERNLLLKTVTPHSVVVELGTGMGFISMLAAKICGEKRVFTYEANPLVEPIIRENYALNDIHPHLTMKAVTKDGRDLEFHAAENIISSSAFERDTPSKRFNVSSIAFNTVLELRSPDILIIDVEGAEHELLVGANMHTVRDIIVELHPHIIGEDKVEQVSAFLIAQGFSKNAVDRKTAHFSRSL